MLSRVYRLPFFAILICVFTAGIAQERYAVEGEAVRYVKNRKDIYHPKNDLDRRLLIKQAIIDAIDRNAKITVSGLTQYNVKEVNTDDYEENLDEFVSSTLQQYNVSWQRTSPYIFSRDPAKKKKWHCKVKGTIGNLEVAPVDQEENLIPELGYQSIFISRKSFDKVHLSAGANRGLRPGDKFVVRKYRNKQSLVGHNMLTKEKAQIYVTTVGEDFAVGKVVKGFFRPLLKEDVYRDDFPVIRSGIKYELYIHEEELGITKLGPDPTTIKVTSHYLSYFHWNFVNRFGFELGSDFMRIVRNDGVTDVGFNPKVGAMYNLGIIPEVLYFSPKMYLGYAFFNNNEEIFETNEATGNVTYEAKLGLTLRLFFLDFHGGMSYRYVLHNEKVTNFYPYFGIGVNLNRN